MMLCGMIIEGQNGDHDHNYAGVYDNEDKKDYIVDSIDRYSILAQHKTTIRKLLPIRITVYKYN